MTAYDGATRPRKQFPRRILALVAAIAMVGGAFAIRRGVIEDDDESNDNGSGNGGDGRMRVVCISELEAVCDTLDATVTIEPAGTTAARLADAPDRAALDFDAWVTFAPWSQIARDQRERAGRAPLLTADAGPLARTPLVLAARNDRAEVLRAHCGGEVTWTCIGEIAGRPWTEAGGDEAWGAVRPAHAEPVTSATGLLVLGHAVGSFLASPDIPIESVSRLDWDTDSFAGWFQQLERSVPDDAFAPGRDPFARWLQARRGLYDIVATTEAAAVPALARSAADIKNDVTVLYPAPVATADVVLVGLEGGRTTEDFERALPAALADAGFRVGGSAPPPGAPALPATSGLPSAGALDALRGLWEEVVQ